MKYGDWWVDKGCSIPDLEPVETFDWLPRALIILLYQLANACIRGCD